MSDDSENIDIKPKRTTFGRLLGNTPKSEAGIKKTAPKEESSID